MALEAKRLALDLRVDDEAPAKLVNMICSHISYPLRGLGS